jgi:hypothetical protein
MARHHRRREARDPWTADPRDPLELLARLVGRTAQAPGMGKGGVPLTDSYLTGALGYMSDKVGAALAMSVAGRHDAMLGYIVRRAHKRVLRSLAEARPRPIDLRNGADRYRLRGVLADVTAAMIWPERRIPMAKAAKAAKMRTGAYCALYRHVEGVMNGVLADARRDFMISMWADEIPRRAPSVDTDQPSRVFGVAIIRVDVEPWAPLLFLTGHSIPDIAAEIRAMKHWPDAQLAAEVLVHLPIVTPRLRRTETFAAAEEQTLMLLATAW